MDLEYDGDDWDSSIGGCEDSPVPSVGPNLNYISGHTTALGYNPTEDPFVSIIVISYSSGAVGYARY